jgi:hypothetical protein
MMSGTSAAGLPIEILPPPVGSVEERERRLIEAVVALARSLRDERDRLAARLREVERELSLLASKMEAREHAADGLGGTDDLPDPFSGRETAVRAVRPRRPSRTSV